MDENNRVVSASESPVSGSTGPADPSIGKTVNKDAYSTNETTYTAAEFSAAAEKLFGKKYTPHLVLAAFIFNGVQQATRDDGIKMVDEFAERKVR